MKCFGPAKIAPIAVLMLACAQGHDIPTGNTAALAPPPVYISEIHYDNTGTDVGEAIEVNLPAGADLTGWTVVLYNLTGGATYDTDAIGGLTRTVCGDRAVVVLDYPSNGIQNGPQDGIALVDNNNAVVEFLSYEGVLTAVNGPAAGLTSTDIGVLENGTEAVGLSLKRSSAGDWSAVSAESFGECNDGGGPPPNPVASVTIAPTTATINVGQTQAFTATALDANGQPTTATFTWSSSSPTVATVSGTGVATGVAAGDTMITATTGAFSASAALHVNEAPPPPTGEVQFNEIHYDNSGTDVGEALEIEGPAGASVEGWSIVLYDGTGGLAYGTTPITGVLPTSCTNRGVMAFTYPVNGIQNGPDGLALVDNTGAVQQFISYEGTFTAVDGPAAGLTSTDIGAQQVNTDAGNSLQRNASGVWALGANTFGACNTVVTPPGKIIQFSGRLPSEPPLPVGFEDQLFGTLRSGGTTIPATFTWSSETPDIATIDQLGVMHSLAAGTAIIRATADDPEHTTATFSLPTRVAVASTTALYEGNAEFGEPTDADASDDFIVRYPQYTASYNPNRGSPNWVAFELDPTHYGPEDRCDCFTTDPALPSTFTHLSTADYTGAGAFHGYGIDRGHMARSFDRTSASLDNANTYLFTNIVPQAADLNQGPWAILENELGDMARSQGKEVYVIAGVAGNKGTIKNEGKIIIPTSTWKVAVIVPHDTGLEEVHSYTDVQVIAVNMPNDPGVRNIPWQTYLTTVDAIEALSGYDLLALLPDDIEAAVESNTQPPIVVTNGPYSGSEGGTVALSAAGSSDPNGSIVSYEWSFGDGGTASGESVTHTYAQDGQFTVRLVVTDNDGLATTVFTTAGIANVAPVVGAFAGATLLPGESFTAAGSFTDPGADPWTATVSWGDGSPATVTALPSRSFSVAHTYAAAGTFTVNVSIADDDTSGAASQTVIVQTPVQALASAATLVDQLVSAGKLNRVTGTLFKAQLSIASTLVQQNQNGPAVIVLRALVLQIDTLVRLRGITAADAAPLRALLVRIIAAID